MKKTDRLEAAKKFTEIVAYACKICKEETEAEKALEGLEESILRFADTNGFFGELFLESLKALM